MKIDEEDANQMAYTYHELKEQNLAQLREIAATSTHEALQGYSQLNKEHLLVQLCKAFNIDMHEHHKVVGIDKTKVKTQIKELKVKRDAALASHDSDQLKIVRREIHRLKRQMHKAMV
jgi:hypothetical protein